MSTRIRVYQKKINSKRGSRSVASHFLVSLPVRRRRLTRSSRCCHGFFSPGAQSVLHGARHGTTYSFGPLHPQPPLLKFKMFSEKMTAGEGWAAIKEARQARQQYFKSILGRAETLSEQIRLFLFQTIKTVAPGVITE